jgi:hypothetical protein
MAKKKETKEQRIKRYESEILEVITTKNIMNIQSIFAYYGDLKSSQFYNLGLEKSESIKEAINTNKLRTKHSLWNKWYKSDNATLQIALFKSICSDEERKKLSHQYIEQDTTLNTEPPLFPDESKDDDD